MRRAFRMPSREACEAFDAYRRARGEFVRTHTAHLFRRIVIGWIQLSALR